jgi:intracellular septation protein A
LTSSPGLKHWRSFGADEWRHVRDGGLGLLLGSVLPVVLFYVAYQTAGFTAAVLVVLTWSALVFVWHYRRTRGADVFSATTFGFACIKALAGLASQNTWLYLAWPSLENLIYGVAFFGSAVAGRPLLALYAERLYPIPAEVRASQTFRRAFLVASAAWLLGHSVRAVVRLWLLNLGLPLSVYLVLDTVAGWPINVSLVAFTAWYPMRELRRGGFMTQELAPMASVDTVELVLEESAPTTV